MCLERKSEMASLVNTRTSSVTEKTRSLKAIEAPMREVQVIKRDYSSDIFYSHTTGDLDPKMNAQTIARSLVDQELQSRRSGL